MARPKLAVRDRAAEENDKARTMMRRLKNMAIANELHQEQREQAAIVERGVEPIQAEAYL